MIRTAQRAAPLRAAFPVPGPTSAAAAPCVLLRAAAARPAQVLRELPASLVRAAERSVRQRCARLCFQEFNEYQVGLRLHHRVGHSRVPLGCRAGVATRPAGLTWAGGH